MATKTKKSKSVKKLKLRASIVDILNRAVDANPMFPFVMGCNIARETLIEISERAIELNDKKLLDSLRTLDLIK